MAGVAVVVGRWSWQVGGGLALILLGAGTLGIGGYSMLSTFLRIGLLGARAADREQRGDDPRD